MATGRLLAPRMSALFEKVAGKGESLEKTLAKSIILFQDEAYEIVRETLHWNDEKMEELAYEDLFTLMQKILEVCILRGKDEGVLGKMLALVLTTSGPRTPVISPGLSSTSAPTDTASEKPESTPPSS